MKYLLNELNSFHIVGIAIRTTNKNGQSQNDIGNLWQRFFQEHVSDKITNKENENIYCLYTDYENGCDAFYNTIIGYKVDQLTELPQGLVFKTVPHSKYYTFQSKGKIPDVVISTWQHIWQSDIKRKWSVDFDIYKESGGNELCTEVDTFVSTD